MPINMNVFRVLGDVSHTASKCILIWAIHSNKSAEGVSLITQILYVAVFLTRYLDLFWVSPAISYWNFVLKNFYIFSSLYIILLMMKVYARTREREKAWRLGAYCLIGAVVLAPVLTGIDDAIDHKYFIFSDMLWNFSIVLESVCVVPQLLLLRQTTVPTVIDSFYLLTLGSYRAFYILNWIVRAVQHERPDWQAVIFGIIQTALYVDFAWVYWTRQRVKLRNGGIVDSDDLSRGFLVSRVLGRGDTAVEDEERAGTDAAGHSIAGTRKGKWGPRGVSVSAQDSADEGILDSRAKTNAKGRPRTSNNDEDGLAGLMNSDDSEDDDTSQNNHDNSFTDGNRHGQEWRDESGV